MTTNDKNGPVMIAKNTEIEITMVICSEKPESVADRIRGLTEVAGYKVGFSRSNVINDFYFDTRPGHLKSGGWALRLRKIDNSYFIALKGPGTICDSGSIERSEIEGPWSPEIFRHILNELQAGGCEIILPATSSSISEPLHEMEIAGFRLVQTRETVRRTADIFKVSQQNTAAELALDAVKFRFGECVIGHHELELESKSEDCSDAIISVAEDLKNSFGSELRLWPHSKLATGLAIEKLIKDGFICSNSFDTAAYDRIDAILKTGLE